MYNILQVHEINGKLKLKKIEVRLEHEGEHFSKGEISNHLIQLIDIVHIILSKERLLILLFFIVIHIFSLFTRHFQKRTI